MDKRVRAVYFYYDRLIGSMWDGNDIRFRETHKYWFDLWDKIRVVDGNSD